ncbi:MAG: hypothetical protein LBI10_03560 [Deltaproteobacteria bacterium]|jgi:hypothetical protein|nr:hypothetical protein [Deltaproteobacteria bacterium]
MTSTNDYFGETIRRRILWRTLKYLVAFGYSPEECLSLSQKVLAENPEDLATAFALLRGILPLRAQLNFPQSAPPINRSFMVTDQEANGDIFNDFEL